jgi:hypothetical protein
MLEIFLERTCISFDNLLLPRLYRIHQKPTTSLKLFLECHTVVHRQYFSYRKRDGSSK